MATYAIGDIQGCYKTLSRLIKKIPFQKSEDRLWAVGDLVNRGPRSADVLRWARDQGPSFVSVLGNHDLHLLARAQGIVGPKKKDNLEDVLKASDRDELLQWLRERPLIHRNGSHILVHGGLHPAWTSDGAVALSREAELAIQGSSLDDILRSLFEEVPLEWDESLTGLQRIQAIIAIVTKIRTCTEDGRLSFDFKGAPDKAPSGYLPWFSVPGRKSQDMIVIFGHWSTLGLHLTPNVIALDTGCVWGNVLTAVRLEDRAVFQEPYSD